MIVLIGYMGSGKTTISKVISKKLEIECFDLDTFIEETEKKSISEIFKTKGEIYFRKQERKILEKLLMENPDIILSLGGGTPCFGDNMKLIKEKSKQVFYLKLTVEALTERLFVAKEKRPLISHLATREALEEFIRKHLFERNFYYLQAHHIVNATAKSPDEISNEIIGLL